MAKQETVNAREQTLIGVKAYNSGWTCLAQQKWGIAVIQYYIVKQNCTFILYFLNIITNQNESEYIKT